MLWFDALVGNVDRSWRNPNMLFWHGRLQLIDHGAALTFHHHWPGAAAAVTRPYDARAHALIGCAPDVPAADAALGRAVTAALLDAVLAQVPDEWLADGEESPDAVAQPVRRPAARPAGRARRLAARAGRGRRGRRAGRRRAPARARTGRPGWGRRRRRG